MKIENFKEIDSLHHSEFEVFVRDLFLSAGWSDAYITKLGEDFKSGDGGVDIFAYRNGKKFAIEVKQRALGTQVDVKALNQLVAGAKLAKASNLILVTNSYFTNEVKVRALRLGLELVDRDELQNLWHVKHSEIGREIKPRKYQSEIIRESYEKYKSGSNRLLMEMATGLGKTYTVALLMKELMEKDSRVLFLAHQVEILLQTVTAFKNVFGIGDFTFSACFSGAAPENTSFVFASFDTLYSRLSQLRSDQFDFIIVDEAHHTPASTYSQVVEAFAPKLLVGLTATPFRGDNKDVNAFFGGEDGHIGKYDLVWALANKKLAFPRYHVLLDDLDQSKIDQLETGLSVSDLDKRLFLHRKDEEVVRIIEKTIDNKQLDPVKGIVFCRNIDHINHLIKFFELGSATYVHSKQSEDSRRENLRKFREDSYRFILVCDLFNEGVDIPEANLLVFMRYTGSQTVWLQQLGRGLRKTANKDFVDVLDFVGSLERLEQITGFARAVNRTKPEAIENDDEVNQLDPKFHDSTIDVLYSESAAKVLDLIENLKFRLNSRSNLIEKLTAFYASEMYVPQIHQLEVYLESVSPDQIATHFDSYYGYLKAAFGDDLNMSIFYERVYKFIDEYRQKNYISPSLRAISSGLSFGFLPYISENELEDLGVDPSTCEFTKNESGALGGSKELHLNELNTNIDLKSEEVRLPPDIEKEPNEQRELIRHYVDLVRSRNDFESLADSEKEKILREFKSPSLFLAKLSKVRKASK
ncbi:DEAD/DEAH box helicase family protein [Halospina sp. K52047b]|uniref:DEAD/DEAH box helicase family protein n=1 Tax=Halospina sp. K52047b TaxID=2614160 RepID=UPI001249FC3A|nr:DEAD/DEAH box helicase family protein [Halospina sp. K52047b]KAA8981193.1 DEAD/DEAH box helicase [Halospina sp. K52047b]